MPKQIFKDPHLVVDGNDLSGYADQLTFNYSAEMQDSTTFGTDGTQTSQPGMKNFEVTVNFKHDDAAALDAILFGLVGDDGFTVAFRPNSGSASSSNPEYSASMVLEGYSPPSGSIGEISTTSVTFRPAGALTRSTGA